MGVGVAAGVCGTEGVCVVCVGVGVVCVEVGCEVVGVGMCGV